MNKCSVLQKKRPSEFIGIYFEYNSNVARSFCKIENCPVSLAVSIILCIHVDIINSRKILYCIFD